MPYSTYGGPYSGGPRGASEGFGDRFNDSFRTDNVVNPGIPGIGSFSDLSTAQRRQYAEALARAAAAAGVPIASISAPPSPATSFAPAAHVSPAQAAIDGIASPARGVSYHGPSTTSYGPNAGGNFGLSPAELGIASDVAPSYNGRVSPKAGAIFGGLLGTVVGGPIGGILGALAGNKIGGRGMPAGGLGGPFGGLLGMIGSSRGDGLGGAGPGGRDSNSGGRSSGSAGSSGGGMGGGRERGRRG